MTFIDECKKQLENEKENYRTEKMIIDRIMPRIQNEIKLQLMREENTLQGIPFINSDAAVDFLSITKAKAMTLFSQPDYIDFYSNLNFHTDLNLPFVEKYFAERLIELGCQIKEVSILSKPATYKEKIEKEILFFTKEKIKFYQVDRYLLYLDVYW